MSIVRKNTGFTMIELIVVVALLGILAAVALPRFISVGGKAREAALDAAVGAVRSASALAHSNTLAAGNAQNTAIDLGSPDGNVTMINFYPTANAAGVVRAANLGTDYSTSGGGASAGDTITISVADASGTCQVTYTAPANTTTAPTITPDSSGCN